MLGAGGVIVDQGNYKDLSARHVVLRKTVQTGETPISVSTETTKDDTTDYKKQTKDAATTQQDIEDLNRRTGDVTVYNYYFKSIGYPLAISFLVVSCLSTFFTFFPQIWLQWWSDYDSKYPGQRKGLYLGVYGALSFTNLFSFGASIWFMFILVTPKSAKRLHWILLQTVMRAPYTFMVKGDTGVVLNRFSQDMSLIDIKLPQSGIMTTLGLFDCIAATIIIATTAKWISLIIPPGFVIVWFIQKFYLRTSRQLRFLDLESKSPLYTHFSETLNGLATIRAFGWQTSFSRQNLDALDASQRPYYLLFCLQCWLNLVMDIFVAFIAIVLVACAVKMNSTSGGMIGLALVSVLMFNQRLAELIHAWTMLETTLGAIARVKNFATTTVAEDYGVEKDTPPENWPVEGRVHIEHITSSYGPDAIPVLQEVNIHLKAGQKIGICGRTGSGKSSLILTLYRLLEITSGTIHIDGLNLATLSREALRSKLIAIPQEPFLRLGTVRSSIDPQSKSSSESIINALTKTGLWPAISSSGGLESDMDALNLSPGQRQLFCLATAILRKGKVLVLDEATSSVDGETERVMQKLIEEEFKEATVITVAHRLETIMDSDLIAVMDRGRIVECGSPSELMQKKRVFWELYSSQR